MLAGGPESPEPKYAAEGDAALRFAGPVEDKDAAVAATSKGRNIAADMCRSLNDFFEPQGVQITDVNITDVQLPKTIVAQMAEKTAVIAQNAAQKMNQEFEMLTLKQDEEIATLKQRKKEEREKEQQTGDQKVNEVQVQLDKMKTETKVKLAKIKEESLIKIQDINAEGELATTKLQQDKDAVLMTKRATAQRDAGQLRAETEKFVQQQESEANLEAQRNTARASELMAKAEGTAAPYVEARKQFETTQKRMKVWEALAGNKDLIVSGETDPELNALMLSDAILDSKVASQTTKSQLLAEMLVLQRGSKVMLNMGTGGGD